MIRNKHILVAVLNWGLGHATRSIPIIEKLIKDGNRITLASDGEALKLLKTVFPHLESIALPSYNISYPGNNMVVNMALQLPKIYATIKSEHTVVKNYLNQNDIDIVVSDNRYGCYAKHIKNILISHQLNIQAPLGSSFISRMQAKLINRFDAVWVPDDKLRTLSGKLSNTKWLKNGMEIKFLGPQSRLNKIDVEKEYDVAAILSGPEPQRSHLEVELTNLLSTIDLKCILIRGKQEGKTMHPIGTLKIQSFADKDELSKIICSSRLIVCRSGYSTIMDLAELKAKALFIPTPGQTEQEYLAQRMQDMGMGNFQKQGQIDIRKAWDDLINK